MADRKQSDFIRLLFRLTQVQLTISPQQYTELPDLHPGYLTAAEQLFAALNYHLLRFMSAVSGCAITKFLLPMDNRN